MKATQIAYVAEGLKQYPYLPWCFASELCNL